MKHEIKRYYNSDNTIHQEEHYCDNKQHREDGPAVIWYRRDGSIELEQYWINNQVHREDGPAEIRYSYPSGYVITEKYWNKGKDYTKLVWNWFIINNLICKDMKKEDFNRMWMEIL